MHTRTPNYIENHLAHARREDTTRASSSSTVLATRQVPFLVRPRYQDVRAFVDLHLRVREACTKG